MGENFITPKRVVLGNLTESALSRRLAVQDSDNEVESEVEKDDEISTLWRSTPSPSTFSDVTDSRQSSARGDHEDRAGGKHTRSSGYKVETDVTAFSVTDLSDEYPASLCGKYTVNRKYKAIPTSYRVSCPFLIRGKHEAVIGLRKRNYNHGNWSILGGKEDEAEGEVKKGDYSAGEDDTSDKEQNESSRGMSERKDCGEDEDEGSSRAESHGSFLSFLSWSAFPSLIY